MSNRTVQAAAEGMPASISAASQLGTNYLADPKASPAERDYKAAFDSFCGPLQRLVDLANTQEVLVDLIMGFSEEVRLVGDRKTAIEFLATEIRNQADVLNAQWTDLHNGSVAEATGHRVPLAGEVQ